MQIDKVGLEFQLENIANPTIEGYLINNQGKKIKCEVKKDDAGNIIFTPLPLDEIKKE